MFKTCAIGLSLSRIISTASQYNDVYAYISPPERITEMIIVRAKYRMESVLIFITVSIFRIQKVHRFYILLRHFTKYSPNAFSIFIHKPNEMILCILLIFLLLLLQPMDMIVVVVALNRLPNEYVAN